MKKAALLLTLILAASSLARAQGPPLQATLNTVSTGACTPTSCLTYNVPSGVGAVSISVVGSSGTVEFDVVDVNGNYATVNALPSNSTTQVTSVSVSGTQFFQINPGGYSQVRVRLTAAGSAAVTINASTASARASGGGFNPAAPGAIGATTPAAGTFTTLSTANVVQSVVGGVLRAATTKDTAGNVLGVDIYPDPAITDYGAAAVVGNFYWALAQLPTTGAFLNLHTGTYTFNTLVADTTHVNLKMTCDGWGTQITQGASLGSGILQVGAGTFASHGWEIKNCALIGLGTGSDTGALVHFGSTSYNNVIVHNYFSGGAGAYGGLDLSNSYKNLVDGNTFVSNVAGISLSGTGNQYGNRILNNYITGGTVSAGNCTGAGILLEFPYETTVAHNHIFSSGGSGICSLGSNSSTGRNTYEGNVIVSPAKYCIELNVAPGGTGSETQSSISDNTCTGSTNYSIWLGTGENFNTIIGNKTNLPIISAGANDQLTPIRLLNSRYNLNADFTLAANTNLQNIPGLSWTVPANTNMNIQFGCHLAYSQATANAAVAFGIQDVTVAPTNIFATGHIQTNTSAFTESNLPILATTTAMAIVSATPSAITTVWNADLNGYIEQASNSSASAINIMASTASGSDLVTVKRGSYCNPIDTDSGGSGTGAPIIYVMSATGITPGTSTTAITAIPLNVQVGDKLAAFAESGGAVNTFTFTDTAGNSWTNGTHQNDGQIGNTDMGSSPATNALTEDYVTVTSNNGVSGIQIIVLQYRGGAASSITDVAANAAGGLATSWTKSSFNNANANEVVVLCAGTSTSPRTAGNIGGVASTIRATVGTTFGISCEDKIFTTTQTGITAAMSWPNGYYNGQFGSFK